MKLLITLFLLSLFFFYVPYNTYSQTDIYGGDVSGNWTMTDSPYRIFDDITIPNDSSLTIEAGVEIEFQGHYTMNVQGNLLASGTLVDSIFFYMNDTTGFSDPNLNPGAGTEYG